MAGIAGTVNPFLRGQYAAAEDNRAQEGAQLRGVLAELQARQQVQQMQEAAATAPLRRGLLEAQISGQGDQAALRAAQIQDLQRRGAAAGQTQAAQGALANLLAGGGYQGPVTGPSGVAMTDADALRQVQEAEAQGRQLGVNVPNPGSVQGLAVMADPQRAIPEILRQQRPEKPAGPMAGIRPVTGGYIEMQDGKPVFVRTAQEPRAAQEPLVAIKGSDGKPVLVPRSEAAGKTPASLSGREDDVVVRRVQQFGQMMDKTGLPAAYATLEEALSKVTPDVLPYLTGPATLIPDVALSSKVTEARQALQRMQNIELKERSGAAVTESEYTRFKKEAGIGLLKKPEQVQSYLDRAKRILDKHYQSVGAGFPEDVRNKYFEEVGRVGPYGRSAPSAPSAPPAAPAVNIDALLEKYR